VLPSFAIICRVSLSGSAVDLKDAGRSPDTGVLRYPSDECADCGALHWANLLVFRDNLQCTPKTGLWICNKSVVYVLLCHPSDEGALCAALFRDKRAPCVLPYFAIICRVFP